MADDLEDPRTWPDEVTVDITERVRLNRAGIALGRERLAVVVVDRPDLSDADRLELLRRLGLEP